MGNVPRDALSPLLKDMLVQPCWETAGWQIDRSVVDFYNNVIFKIVIYQLNASANDRRFMEKRK